jgi:EAL domain-containing protein (putative c-di-GMP-specific phosphodiesterase class I)
LDPHKFISVAEETGQIVPIGEWVLRSVCAQVRAWQVAGYDPVPVSVNVSGLQLKQQDFTDRVRRILDETALMPRYVEMELTESFAERDPEQTISILREIRSFGIGLAIDDFGTGYSSLSYLKRYPIDKLKIDRSFVEDIATDPDDTAIVEAIVGVAHGLKLKVVAEGVESPDQLEFLRAQGCDAWQGFCFSHPLPPNDFVGFLNGRREPEPVAPPDAPVDAQPVTEPVDRFLGGDGCALLSGPVTPLPSPPGIYSFGSKRCFGTS